MTETPPFGLWLVDKPAGMTSHDVVARIRRTMHRSAKVGHAGTLDPFATGLLLVLVGRATRLMQFLVGHDKSYRATVKFGATSTTGDRDGEITGTGIPCPSADRIAAAVAELPGTHDQRVPAYAAVKVDGEPLHRRARRGETVAAPIRSISIRAAHLVDCDPLSGWAELEVRCSKGTYIRQLAADLGDELGCGAYCDVLRRLSIGELHVDDAVPPELAGTAGAVDPRVALAPMPERELTTSEHEDIRHGRRISGPIAGPTMLIADGRLVAIGEPDDAGEVRPRVVLA